jgi:hypothetical protein
MDGAAASAATCDDYSNQAEAQRAKDTRDADGDGIYCEALPCPCLTPGEDSGGGGGGPTPIREPKPRKRAQVIDARITSIVDGDTVKVKAFGAKRDFYTVRLLGIDTPETKKPGTPVECGGKRATASMMRLGFTEPSDEDGDGLEDTEGGEGRRVTLTTDPTQANLRPLREAAGIRDHEGGHEPGGDAALAGLGEGLHLRWQAVPARLAVPGGRTSRACGRTWGMEALRRQLPRTCLSRASRVRVVRVQRRRLIDPRRMRTRPRQRLLGLRGITRNRGPAQ